MHRRNILGISALVVALAMLPGGAGAQQKSMKDQLIGAWTLLLADNIKDDGSHIPGYGPNPELGRDRAKAPGYGDHRRSPDLEHAGAVGRRLCACRGGVEEGKVSARPLFPTTQVFRYGAK